MWTELNRFALSLYTRWQIKKEDGQALVEYTLILALISVVAIGVLTNIGNDITAKLKLVEEKL